jgi:hypothetical protein
MEKLRDDFARTVADVDAGIKASPAWLAQVRSRKKKAWVIRPVDTLLPTPSSNSGWAGLFSSLFLNWRMYTADNALLPRAADPIPLLG